MHVTVGLRRRIARQTQHRAELTPETLIVALDLGKRWPLFSPAMLFRGTGTRT